MRDMKDFSGVLREGVWIGLSIAAAVAFTQLTEDKGGQVPFVSVSIYLVSSALRFAIRTWRTQR